MDFTLDIAAPVARVFSVIADLPAYGSWLPASGLYAGSTVPSETPLRLGTTYTDHARGATLDGRVTLFEPPHRISFSQDSQQPLGRLSVDITYELEATDAGTRLHRTTVPHYSGVLRLLAPLLTRGIRKENERTLAAMKRHLEAEPSA